MTYQVLKDGCGVVATVGLYTVLYRENRCYRFFEHLFLGLAVGYALVAMWTQTLHDQWWTQFTGSANAPGVHGAPGYWAYLTLLPVGALGYLIFSKKYNWMSRIPIGVILGLWAGQQLQVWFTQYGPQLYNSMRPIIPNDVSRFTRPSLVGLDPATTAAIKATTYPSQAIDNLIFLITLLSVLSYFLFSFEVKGKLLARTQLTGRWLLMIGFGAIFGATVMMRFALLIDRMHYIFIEFIMRDLLHRA